MKKTTLKVYSITFLSFVYLIVFFFGPFISVVYFSFLRYTAGQPLSSTEYTLANYAKFLKDPWYYGVVGRSFKISVIVTFFSLMLGYPMAYWLDRRVKRHSGILIGLLLSPILISLVVQSYGWLVLLSPRGVVNSVLLHLSLVERPIKLIFNEVGVVIGLLQFILPFVVLSVLTSLQNINRALENAAQNLGANNLKTFWRITLPLSMPGIFAGGVLAFLLAFSAIVTPILMGGQVVITLPILAFQQFGQSFNWAFGSTIVTILTVLVVVILAILNRSLKVRQAGVGTM